MRSGHGEALTYSILSAWSKGLLDIQGCQSGLEEGSSVFHTLLPSWMGWLQRQSWVERLCPGPLLHHLSKPILPRSSLQRGFIFWTSHFISLYWSHQWYTLLLNRRDIHPLPGLVFGLGWVNHPCLLPSDLKASPQEASLWENNGFWGGGRKKLNLSV